MLFPCAETGVMASWIIEWSEPTMELKVFLNIYNIYIILVFIWVLTETFGSSQPVFTCVHGLSADNN